MFIRCKKIKGLDYAYLVNNKWTRQGARQKVSRYLGKVIEPEKVASSDYVHDENLTAQESLAALVRWVLEDHGFERKGNFMMSGSTRVSMKSFRVTNNMRPAVLRFENEYMCSHTLGRLLRFSSDKDQHEVAVELAGAFITAGIPIPKDAFIDIFQKVYKEGQSRL